MHPEMDYHKTGNPTDKEPDYHSATIANLKQQLTDAGEQITALKERLTAAEVWGTNQEHHCIEQRKRAEAAEAALEEFKRRERRRLYETCPDECNLTDAQKCAQTKECHKVDAARLAALAPSQPATANIPELLIGKPAPEKCDCPEGPRFGTSLTSCQRCGKARG